MNERPPVATYRLQLNSRFTFRDALALVDYLDGLGISHVYASPVAAARSGSLHGYDVIDPARLNPEIGSPEEFRAFSDALLGRGMGLILDIVPNHMCATDSRNRWWQDVLEKGASSEYAKYFDIDFHPEKVDLSEKILLPILGEQFGKVLESQQIQVGYEEGGFQAHYGSQRLPLALESWSRILEPALARLSARVSPEHPDLLRLEDLLLRIREHEASYESKKVAVSARLQALYQHGNGAREAIDDSIRTLNGQKGEPGSFDGLETLLFEQPYRLSYWRVATDEVNYRRFFDINDLVAIRVEEPEVFRATHELALGLMKEGRVSGLRIDHVDGLLEPVRYLEALRTLAGEAGAGDSFLLLVEKVLDQEEHLDRTWPVDGTTGYEFLNVLNGLFVQPDGLAELESFYDRFARRFEPTSEVVYRSKRLTMATSMAGELHVLARRLDRISEQHRSSRDFTLKSLEAALAEVIACFPIYRTYVDSRGLPSPVDRSVIESAVAAARSRNVAMNESVFWFIQEVLLLDGPTVLTEAQKTERVMFVMRFQQLTGPVMAKGLEDTACYRRYPLASLCEVGGRPDRMPTTPSAFHQFSLERQERWGRSLSATSTHDTKRSEDVRARLNVLTEMPHAWSQAVQDWAKLNAPLKLQLGPRTVPDANEEYFLYQTVLSTLPEDPAEGPVEPAYLARLGGYLPKALREARVHSSWMGPNLAYEQASFEFLAAILDPDHGFLEEARRWLATIRRGACWNTLAQVLLKATSPGIPDFYQGAELLDLRLADPDNRQPLDYSTRRRALEGLPAEPSKGTVRALLARSDLDRLKMLLIRETLRVRRENAELFLSGGYVPLEVRGPASDHLLAFMRKQGSREVVVLAGRFLAAESLGEGRFWTGTEVPELSGRRVRDLLWDLREASGEFSLDAVLEPLPMALLERLP